MAFPSPPWRQRGHVWGSLFRAAPPDGPPGLYAAAFVEYGTGSTLEYSELVVARRTPGTLAAVTVRDIWVDLAASREGGRALWSLPKELGAFSHESSGLGVAERHDWSAAEGGRRVAAAEFLDTSRLAVRLPLRGSGRQPTVTAGEARLTMRGSARPIPCLAHWSFAATGPLGWLADHPPLVSFRLRDFVVDFDQ